jgi:arylsulfatase A-like enzyme
MKAIMVMFDSLNRHMLPPYGGDWVHAPNFSRLAERSVTFDRAYIGSMPCIPARRELHTGRYNFLHRSWGPMEPFDDSMPQMLKDHGIHSHLVTDHQHYWEDGGSTYHNRYNTYEFVRGQEGDKWKGQLSDPSTPPSLNKKEDHILRQDWINRSFAQTESDMPQARTFELGLEFIQRNKDEDNWFLQLETFDPHEPFFTQQQWKDLYPHEYGDSLYDWPPYKPVTETTEQVQHLRYEYAALMSMCDAYLGKILDVMDENNLWEDTMLIVNTDHGYLLGEHDWWAKLRMPWYNELANTPLFIWDPRSQQANQHRDSLVQTIDLPATILEFFGIAPPTDMEGVPLRQAILDDTPVRDYALFGVHGWHVNITDGRYVYMRAPTDSSNEPLNEYTLMPMHMRQLFSPDELNNLELQEPFSFTKGCRTLKIKPQPAAISPEWSDRPSLETLLFDIESDPTQSQPIRNEQIELQMIENMVALMRRNNAPLEQYERLGLTQYIKPSETL